MEPQRISDSKLTTEADASSISKVPVDAASLAGSTSAPKADVEHMGLQQPGVSRIEAFARVVKQSSWTFYAFLGFFSASVLAFGLDGTTTYSFESIAASSYGEHGQLLGTIGIVTSILRAFSRRSLV